MQITINYIFVNIRVALFLQGYKIIFIHYELWAKIFLKLDLYKFLTSATEDANTIEVVRMLSIVTPDYSGYTNIKILLLVSYSSIERLILFVKILILYFELYTFWNISVIF